MDWGMRCRKLLSGEKCSHSHKTRTDSLETRAVFLIFSLELEISGVAGQKIHQSTKNDGFCEELLSKNDFVKIVNGLVNIYPIPTLPVGIGNTLAIFTTNQYALLSIECTGISSSWLNWRGEEGLFWRLQKERHIVLSHWLCVTWKFFMIWSHKILKLIFQKQLSCPRNK